MTDPWIQYGGANPLLQCGGANPILGKFFRKKNKSKKICSKVIALLDWKLTWFQSGRYRLVPVASKIHFPLGLKKNLGVVQLYHDYQRRKSKLLSIKKSMIWLVCTYILCRSPQREWFCLWGISAPVFFCTNQLDSSPSVPAACSINLKSKECIGVSLFICTFKICFGVFMYSTHLQATPTIINVKN